MWTDDDLAAITEAVPPAAPDSLRRLTEHFDGRPDDLTRAWRAVADLAAGRTIEAGDGTLITRDAPQALTGRAVRDVGA